MESLGFVLLGFIFIWLGLKMCGEHMKSSEPTFDFVLGLFVACCGFGIELGVLLL